MKVVNYFDTDNKERWLDAIGKSDWRAGPFLKNLLASGTFFETLGESSRVLLLTEGDELVSYCTYAEKDDIQPTELTPWVGFVYTFPARRGRRFAGLLFDEVERLAREAGVREVFLSTNHVGLYEKYGWEFMTMMTDIDCAPSRIYVKRVAAGPDRLVGYCGLDCRECEARIATVNNDDALRAKVAKLWSELNHVEITPEMINCLGCRVEGPKTVFCESLCAIRKCAAGKAFETCGGCAGIDSCEKLRAITDNRPDALERLKNGG